MEAYDIFRRYRDQILEASAVLAGEEVGPSGESWQQVAARLAKVCRQYADVLDTASLGGFYGPIVFPSWQEGGAE